MMSKKRPATEQDLEHIGKLIQAYCDEHNIQPATISEQDLGLYFRRASLTARHEAIEQQQAIVDSDMLQRGYVPIDTAAEQLGMKWEQLSELIRHYRLKATYRDTEGKQVSKNSVSRAGVYIALDDIVDKDAIVSAYEQVRTVSTEHAAKIMGVTSGTFSKWAKRAGITPKDEQWTNSGYKVYLWSLEQVNAVIEYRKDAKS